MSPSAVAGPAKTMRWSDELDRDLLLAIVSQIPGYDVTRLVDMEKIARKLGPNCSTRAIEERLKKLKKQASGLMDETAPRLLGGTRKMEAEFRAKKEAEIAAVQRRGPRPKAKKLSPSPEDDPETTSKKTAARASAATTVHGRNKKGTARIIKKSKFTVTEETDTEEEADDASSAAEDLGVGEAANTGTTHDNSPKSNHHRDQKEATDVDTREPSKPSPEKREQAPVSVIELDSDEESSAPPPAKKRKQEIEKVKDHPPTSTAVKHQRDHTTNPAPHESED